MPHGTVWCELALSPDEDLWLWCTDLPSFYYAIGVSGARAASNRFTPVLPLAPLAHLSAVRDFMAATGRDQGALALRVMAMGDINATGFAQIAHRALLQRAGALPPELAYRQLAPDDEVVGGVMIDDYALAAKGPRRGAAQAPAVRRAANLFRRARAVYAAAGVPDVDKKRREMVRHATVWGAEIDGRAGTVGAPRTRRAGLSALTASVAVAGVAPGTLVSSLLGLWMDSLLYRRPVLALLGAVFAFAEAFGEDRRPRALPGPVRSELLGLSALAPMLECSIRAPVAPGILVSDASLSGTGVVEARLPSAAAAEVWRHRVRAGGVAEQGCRGFCFGGELVEALPVRVVHRAQFKRRAGRGIHVCEGRARRQLAVAVGRDPGRHGTRQLTAYDSTVTAFGAARGRSHAPGLLSEQRLAYPQWVAAGAQEGVVWVDSERNSADSTSRGGPLPVPAPMRAWVARFLGGDASALADRITRLAQEAEASGRDFEAEAGVDPALDLDLGATDWPTLRNNARRTRASDRRAAAAGVGTIPAVRPRGCGQGGHAAERVGEASHPGPPRAQAAARATARPAADLVARAEGRDGTRHRRAGLIAAFESWLRNRRGLELECAVTDPRGLDRALATYGQVLFDQGAPQSHLPELLNGLRNRYRHLDHQLGEAWAVRTAWQLLEPGTSRTPVPAELARAMVAVALVWGWLPVAALIALAWEGCLRTGDVLGLARCDLRFPQERGDGGCGDIFVILRHAKTATTYGARFQHVRVSCSGVIALLWAAFGTWTGEAELFQRVGTHAQREHALAWRFERLCRALGVPYGEGAEGGITFGGLRAGGTTAAFEATRDLQLVRWRGRWDSMRTLEHYVQELAYWDFFPRLPPAVRARVRALARLLPKLLARLPP